MPAGCRLFIKCFTVANLLICCCAVELQNIRLVWSVFVCERAERERVLKQTTVGLVGVG